IARHWPGHGEHGHDVVMALAGALLRSGLSAETVKKIVLTAAKVGGYPRAKEADIDDTVRNLAEGRQVTGWPTLAQVYDRKILGKVSEWLDIVTSQPRVSASSPAVDAAKGINLLAANCEYQDAGNARRFKALYSDRVRYSHSFKKWLIYKNGAWRIAKSGEAMELARQTIRLSLAQSANAGEDKSVIKFFLDCLANFRLRALLEQAQSEPPLCNLEVDEEVSVLDAYDELLNFRNGTLDLRTGRLLPHCTHHMLTKQLNFNYNPEGQCP